MEDITLYSPQDRDDVVRLLASQPLKEDLWTWQYTLNPASSRGVLGVVARAAGQVVGFVGTIPTRVMVNGSPVDAAWAVDAHVDERYRGRRLGSRLFSAMEKASPLMLAYGMTDVSAAMLQRRGWTFSGEIEEFYFQNRITSASGLLKTIRQVSSARRRWSHEWTHHVDDVPATALPSECDALWASVQSDYAGTVVRDYAYLKWKYADHPAGCYRALLASVGGRLTAVAIYRSSARWGRFVDYLGPASDLPLKSDLLMAFMQRSRKSRLLNVQTTDPMFRHCLLRAGYRVFRVRPRLGILPSPRLDAGSAGWFIMSGDSDGDMLYAMAEHPPR